MKKVWTEEEDRYIKIYYKQETNKQIAEEINVSTTLISKRMKELGLKKINRSEIIEINGEKMKYCRKCEKYISLNNFSKNKHKPNGYNCWCKFHTNEHQANKKLEKMIKESK